MLCITCYIPVTSQYMNEKSGKGVKQNAHTHKLKTEGKKKNEENNPKK